MQDNINLLLPMELYFSFTIKIIKIDKRYIFRNCEIIMKPKNEYNNL